MLASEKIDAEVLDQLWQASFKKLGYGKLKIAGESMTPLINIGDRVKVSAIEDPRSVRVGALVLFKTNGYYLVHRIVGKLNSRDGLHFRQKGDATILSSIISADQIIGKVTAIEKPDRIIHLNRFTGKSINLLLVMHLVIIEYLYRVARKMKKLLFPDGSDFWIQPFTGFVKRTLWKAQKVVLRLTLRA